MVIQNRLPPMMVAVKKTNCPPKVTKPKIETMHKRECADNIEATINTGEYHPLLASAKMTRIMYMQKTNEETCKRKL
jgi:hypothetical protein